MVVKEIVKKRRFKDYEVRHELIDGTEFGCEDTLLRSAYSTAGDYIGDSKWAFRLAKRGIKPEKSRPEHGVCSIGFCEREQKWYGWSHRAIFGFGVGSSVTQGVAVTHGELFSLEPWPARWGRGEWTARTLDDARQMAVDFAAGVS